MYWHHKFKSRGRGLQVICEWSEQEKQICICAYEKYVIFKDIFPELSRRHGNPVFIQYNLLQLYHDSDSTLRAEDYFHFYYNLI